MASTRPQQPGSPIGGLPGCFALVLTVFLEFQMCRINSATNPPSFELAPATFWVKADSIVGFERPTGFGGRDCVRLLITGQKTRFVADNPGTWDTINRGLRPR